MTSTGVSASWFIQNLFAKYLHVPGSLEAQANFAIVANGADGDDDAFSNDDLLADVAA